MNLAVLILCVGLTAAAMVRWEVEAEPQAEAEAEALGYKKLGGKGLIRNYVTWLVRGSYVIYSYSN